MKIIKQIARFFIAKLYPSLKPFLHLLRPNIGGVKVIIFYKNKLLLIRNTYRKGWTLPGGGIKKNETPQQAAIREICEEVGIIINNLKNHGSFILDFKKGNRTTLFSCKINSPNFKIDNLEVEEAKWVDIKKVSQLHLLPVATKCVRIFKLKDWF